MAIPIIIFAFRLKNWTPENRIMLWIAVSLFGFGAHIIWDSHIRLLMFIAGIILFELFTNKKVTLKHGGEVYLLITILLFGFSYFIDINYTFLVFSSFVFFLLLCLCAFNPESRTYSWLVFTPLRWLGNMSYSYYLLHALTLKFSFFALAYILPNDFSSSSLYYWLWIPLFISTLISSFCLFILIERPFSLNVSKAKNQQKINTIKTQAVNT